MCNEYDWVDSYDSSHRVVTARDVVFGWVVSAIAVVSMLMLFGV